MPILNSIMRGTCSSYFSSLPSSSTLTFVFFADTLKAYFRTQGTSETPILTTFDIFASTDCRCCSGAFFLQSAVCVCQKWTPRHVVKVVCIPDVNYLVANHFGPFRSLFDSFRGRSVSHGAVQQARCLRPWTFVLVKKMTVLYLFLTQWHTKRCHFVNTGVTKPRWKVYLDKPWPCFRLWQYEVKTCWVDCRFHVRLCQTVTLAEVPVQGTITALQLHAFNPETKRNKYMVNTSCSLEQSTERRAIRITSVSEEGLIPALGLA